LIIGLSGYAGSGKDTAGEILVKHHGFTRVAFADRLKELALRINPDVAQAVAASGWETAKREEYVRRFLQDLGTQARQVLFADVWIRALFENLEPNKHYVITDVRFTNEADTVRKSGGLVVRISRPNVGPVNEHISETHMDDYDFDAHLMNDGSIDDFAARVASLMFTLRISKQRR